MGGRIGIVGAELGDAHALHAWEGDKNISGIYRILQFVSMVIDVLTIIFKHSKIMSLGHISHWLFRVENHKGHRLAVPIL